MTLCSAVALTQGADEFDERCIDLANHGILNFIRRTVCETNSRSMLAASSYAKLGTSKDQCASFVSGKNGYRLSPDVTAETPVQNAMRRAWVATVSNSDND